MSRGTTLLKVTKVTRPRANSSTQTMSKTDRNTDLQGTRQATAWHVLATCQTTHTERTLVTWCSIVFRRSDWDLRSHLPSIFFRRSAHSSGPSFYQSKFHPRQYHFQTIIFTYLSVICFSVASCVFSVASIFTYFGFLTTAVISASLSVQCFFEFPVVSHTTVWLDRSRVGADVASIHTYIVHLHILSALYVFFHILYIHVARCSCFELQLLLGPALLS